jgi:hypothetical protein
MAPTEATSATKVSKASRAMRAIRLVRLAKIVKIGRKIKKYSAKTWAASVGVLAESLRIFLMMLVFSHWLACAYWIAGDDDMVDYENGALADIEHQRALSSESESTIWGLCEPGGPCEEGIYGRPWVRRYGLVESDINFAIFDQYGIAMEVAVGLLTGYGNASVAPGTNPERWFVSVIAIMSFIFCTYVTARFIQVCQAEVEMNYEILKQRELVDDVMALYKIPVSMGMKIHFFVQARFKDVLRKRREPERNRVIAELSPSFRREVLKLAYSDIITRHLFFKRAFANRQFMYF